MSRPATFEEFWPSYLRAHCSRRSRAFHVTGTALAFVCLALFLITFHLGWIVAAAVAAYGLAWAGHLIFEQNVPATFSHPLWSLRGDLRMVWLTLTGRIEAEAARVGCPQNDG